MIADMARKIKEFERSVFDVLDENVKDEYERERIVVRERDIDISDETADFIKRMKWATVSDANDIHAVFYDDDWYICAIDKEYKSDLLKESAKSVHEATGISLIVNKRKQLLSAITETRIIESILAVDTDEMFSFDEINMLFSPHISYQVDKSFNIVYEEDLQRLSCLLEIDGKEYLTVNARSSLAELLLLVSSRSIARLVNNICNTHDFKLIFLQLYRILEYLFIIYKALEMGTKYGVPDYTVVDMLCDDRAFRQTEEQYVFELVSKYASADSKTHYIEYLINYNLISEEQTNVDEALAKYIYRHRCQIAHFKYRQERIIDETTLTESVERFAELILSMYIKLDGDIIRVNEHFINKS